VPAEKGVSGYLPHSGFIYLQHPDSSLYNCFNSQHSVFYHN